MNAVDTNVLVYAAASDDEVKRRAALGLLGRLSLDDTVLLWQVACETGAVLARLRHRGLANHDSFALLDAFRRRFRIVVPTVSVLDEGWRLHSQHQVAYWDALLLASCREAGVTTLYSEDAQSAPEVAGVRIINPFVA